MTSTSRFVTNRKRAIFQAAALLVMIACAAIPMLADGRTPQPAAKDFKCYCQCEGHDGMASCPKKMCELPKYEGRWWATSCHKHAAVPSVSKQPAAQPSGRHTRNILNAENVKAGAKTQSNN